MFFIFTSTNYSQFIYKTFGALGKNNFERIKQTLPEYVISLVGKFHVINYLN